MKRGLSTTQKKVCLELVQQDITGKSIADIAEEYGVNERTIYRWKNDVEFARELEKQTDIAMKAFYAESTHKLKSLVRHGNSEQAVLGAIKLVMQSQGKLRDVTEIDATVKQDIKNAGLTKEDLDALEDLLK
ncbi:MULTISPECIES: phBC6A51 family helix-turn-helix protein [unclassified Exiguobacterium]|uniref:phBC6A51 family helix-turn-helix protein n=1 Tax=unclassified Exiguobacterium TaxID=2644629 RepID=UPI001BE8F770|nr:MULTISPECIES: phBC6A51 family helix-turn-helix protein [unclassified Exiguobacterium]